VRSATTHRELEDAYASGLAVEGRVERAVKGGYEVRIARERAFCPISQIDTARTVDPAVHEGKVCAFRIVEFKDGGRNLVVSRRAVLEEEQRAAAHAIRVSIVPDAVLTGRVAWVLDFGAFVDLGGGIQGLLHVFRNDLVVVRDAVVDRDPGDAITVKVLRVDEASGKISLGLKQLQNDPWTSVAANYAGGQVREGKVTRLTDFGAFVELEPGIEALAHASTFPPTGSPRKWARAVPVGTTAAFRGPERRRGAEAPRHRARGRRLGAGGERARRAGRDRARSAASRQGGAARAVRGVHLPRARRTGLLPASETGVDRDMDQRKAFPAGSEVEVVVLEVGEDGRRIRLSKKAVAEQQEQAELREYAARQDASAAPTLGSLADKLRSALETRKR
jgi:small subunit ribosomal protein S1